MAKTHKKPAKSDVQNETPVEEQCTATECAKKNAPYKLWAFLTFLACVAFGALVCFLPFHVFTDALSIEKQTALAYFKDVFASGNKLFGFLPVAFAGANWLEKITSAIIWVFGLFFVLGLLFSLISLFLKNGVCLLRTALMLILIGSLAYAGYLIGFSVYASHAWNANLNVNAALDLYTAILAGIAILIYCILAFSSGSKTGVFQFILSVAATGLVCYALYANRANVVDYIADHKFYKWFVLAGGVLLVVNNLIGLGLTGKKKGGACSVIHCLLHLVLCLGACALGYFGKLEKSFLFFSLIAAAVALLSVILLAVRLGKKDKEETKEVATEEASAQETVSEPELAVAPTSVESPVVEQISMPLDAALEAEQAPAPVAPVAPVAAPVAAPAAAPAQPATIVGDPFLYLLTSAEKDEFFDLYVFKCKGNMKEIPTYVPGGDNKQFFNKVFIYLGLYRDKISNSLISKMYNYVMKL